VAGFIPLSVPFIRGNESKYVNECLDTEWVSTAGKYVELFEESLCSFTGTEYAIACVNGTSALHVSLRIVGVKTNDEVIIPTVTFIAPVNAVSYLGAHPLCMDCDDFYYFMDPSIFGHIPADTYFGMDDLIHGLLAKNKKIGRHLISEYWLDIGQVEDYSQARKDVAERFHSL